MITYRPDILLRAGVALGLIVAILVLAGMSAAHADPGCNYNADGSCVGAVTKQVTHHRHHATHTDTNGNLARGHCHRETAAGQIVIACHVADRMVGFINDVVARGFKGRVNCFSTSKSHVARSLHFVAEACDFAQSGWNKTVHPMYRVADLAAKWNLRDGCTFRDCGHIDSGRVRSAER